MNAGVRHKLYLIATGQAEGWYVAPVQAGLWILSFMFRGLILARHAFYRAGVFKRHVLPGPVISVGNLTVGGTGKTPLVSHIAQLLKSKGCRPVILTRGYMAASDKRVESDEAAMLRAQLGIPVLAGADRVRSVQAFLKTGSADCFVLDDGFQHWRIKRDLDIVTIDATNPWGNGHVLPRGILREPKRALARADVFVLTKSDIGRDRVGRIRAELGAINPKALIAETVHEPVDFIDARTNEVVGLKSVRGMKVCSVCGVAGPNTFIKTLIDLEADIDGHFTFPDHHVYGQADMERITALCRERGISTLITTEKDIIKWKVLMASVPDGIRVLTLKIRIAFISQEAALRERIYHLL